MIHWQSVVSSADPCVGKVSAGVLIVGGHHTRPAHHLVVHTALVVPHQHAHTHSLPSLLHQ